MRWVLIITAMLVIFNVTLQYHTHKSKFYVATSVGSYENVSHFQLCRLLSA